VNNRTKRRVDESKQPARVDDGRPIGHISFAFTQNETKGFPMLQRVTRPPLQRCLAPLERNYAGLVRQPLSKPATFAGTVDATRERGAATARTIEQAFGPGASTALVKYAESCDAAATRAHNVTTLISAVIAVATIVACFVPAFVK
jgi:hypothetical protein